MKNVKINNNDDLRENLIKAYEGVVNGEVDLREAKETTAIAGKIIASAKLQLQYKVHTLSTKPIQFLEV